MNHLNDSDDDSDDNSYWMMDNDPKHQVTVESVIERLLRSFFTQDYGEADYWNQRYSESPDEYEWFMSWSYVYPYVKEFCKKGKALNLGCGNSPMPSEMISSGFSQVYNIDVSDVLIEQMKKKYSDNSNLIWQTMDCTQLDFPNDYFDCVVDKGTIDALYCSSNSQELISKTLDEVKRVLKPQYFYISISFGNPQSREYLVNYPNMNFLKYIDVTNPKNEESTQFIYIFQK
ncbi:Menaquinone biosynthesis methyltransferase [Tritrichomonas foetus]|uniref:Menaquinone biosynthesis methyltransferase n=1 Tax=Tritrichomonas foetus TaxID=1144522 RepID=A0A1J4J9N9_9EUKA|nr:Menaquinone biosynthesis methyltransferase [Tritrichomonas foetus]|eukprot:OHS95872.1 Menaquinone biosynthesis methyltransferase [Tritrichomonas foetus]